MQLYIQNICCVKYTTTSILSDPYTFPYKGKSYMRKKGHRNLIFWHILRRLKKIMQAWKVSVIGVFLVRIFSHSDWIQTDKEYLLVFSLNAGNTHQKNSEFGRFSCVEGNSLSLTHSLSEVDCGRLNCLNCLIKVSFLVKD